MRHLKIVACDQQQPKANKYSIKKLSSGGSVGEEICVVTAQSAYIAYLYTRQYLIGQHGDAVVCMMNGTELFRARK